MVLSARTSPVGSRSTRLKSGWKGPWAETAATASRMNPVIPGTVSAGGACGIGLTCTTSRSAGLSTEMTRSPWRASKEYTSRSSPGVMDPERKPGFAEIGTAVAASSPASAFVPASSARWIRSVSGPKNTSPARFTPAWAEPTMISPLKSGVRANTWIMFTVISWRAPSPSTTVSCTIT